MALVDLDPTENILDWDCAADTYDGHKGMDVALRSFGEQIIGVPVFTALDGTVVASHDGEEDMNTEQDARPGNYVVIDHDNGHLTAYLHLKKGSVTAFIGQEVRAGEQIGQVGSSGKSNGPHLHFETWIEQADAEWVVRDPFAGDCRPGESGWVDQPSMERSLYLWDFGITDSDMSTFPGSPHTFPRGGQVALTEPHVYFWAKIRQLPAHSTWRVQFQRPDGVVAFDSGSRKFGNRDFSEGIWRWWKWSIPDAHAIPGTWHLLLDLNDSRAIDAPFVVYPDRSAFVNRVPESVSVAFDPLEPTLDDVIFCQVDTDWLLDDPDYDIVRYEYIWTVNGKTVRRVTSAALSDALPRLTALEGDNVACTVTPSDGIEEGEPTLVAAIIGKGPDIAIEPTRIDFGRVKIGQSRTRRMRIRNIGKATLSVSEVAGFSNPFTLSTLQLPIIVLPGEKVEVLLTFTPTTAGKVVQPIGFRSNDPDAPVVAVSLQGEGRG